MNWRVYSVIAYLFFCNVSATKAEGDISNFIHPIAGKCTPQEQAKCDDFEQLCMNTGVDTNKRIACCVQWKSCMNFVGCNTSMFRCE